jgi:hypothetical protein
MIETRGHDQQRRHDGTASFRKRGFVNSIPIGSDLVIGSYSINSFNLSDDVTAARMAGCSAAISRRAFPSTAALERPAAEAAGADR